MNFNPLSLLVARTSLVVTLGLGTVIAALGQQPTDPSASPEPRQTVSDGIDKVVYTVMFSPDSKKIAIGQGDRVKLFDTTNGKELLSLTSTEMKDGFAPIGFRADGEEFVTFTVDTISIWQLKTKNVDRQFSPPGQIRSPLLTANGDTLVYSREDKMGQNQVLTLLDLKTGKVQTEIKVGKPYYLPAISPDGKLVAVALKDGVSVAVYDLQTAKELQTLKKAPLRTPNGEEIAGLSGLAFSPDGKRLAATGAYSFQPLTLWEISTGKQLNELSPKCLGGNGAMAWTPDGKTLAVAGKKIGLWNPDSVQVFEDEIVGNLKHGTRQIAISPDGKTLAAGPVTLDGKSFALWNLPQPGDKKK